MALYTELYSLMVSDPTLRNRVAVAAIIAANTIQNEAANVTNHTNRLLWARQAYDNPEAEGRKLLMAVLSANKTATVAQITGSTDAALQTAVDAAVNIVAGVGV